MFQWDAVGISSGLWGQSVLETFEMAIRRNRRKTRTQLERVSCRWIYFTHVQKYISGALTGGGGAIALTHTGASWRIR